MNFTTITAILKHLAGYLVAVPKASAEPTVRDIDNIEAEHRATVAALIAAATDKHVARLNGIVEKATAIVGKNDLQIERLNQIADDICAQMDALEDQSNGAEDVIFHTSLHIAALHRD